MGQICQSDATGRSGRPITWDEIVRMKYLVAHGKVYDPAPFLMKHQGHPPCIAKGYGTDRSQDYDQHSKAERRIWAEYYIGYVV